MPPLGGRKGALDERSDGGVSLPTTGLFGGAQGGILASLVVLYKSNRSRLKRLRTNYENFWSQDRHPLT